MTMTRVTGRLLAPAVFAVAALGAFAPQVTFAQTSAPPPTYSKTSRRFEQELCGCHRRRDGSMRC